MKRCPKCGIKCPNDFQKCPDCGVKLVKVPFGLSSFKPTLPAVFHGSNMIPLLICIVVLVALIALLVISLLSTRAEVDSLRSQTLALNQQLASQLANFQNTEQDLRRQISSYQNQVTALANSYTGSVDVDYFVSEISRLNSEVSEKQATITQLQSQLEGVQGSLSGAQGQISGLQGELASKYQTLDQLMTQATAVKNEILDLERWVSDNAVLPQTILKELHNVYGDPLSVSGEVCQIDTCKIGKAMASRFTWTDDLVTSGKADFVFDVYKFYNGKVGDCDDFGLFGAAWLRAEIARAKEEQCSTIKVLFADVGYSSCSNYRSMDISDIDDVYSACGCFRGSSGCHCETGISTATPTASNLKSSIYLFEPQSGQYNGAYDQQFQDSPYWIFSSDNYYSSYQGTDLKSLRENIERLL